jgi:hypothetical protein
LSTQYLLDPWFVELKPTDVDAERFNRLSALNQVMELGRRFGLSPVGFIDEEFLSGFSSDFRNYQRPDGHAIGSIIASLIIKERHNEEAVISDSPCPVLPPNWRKALDHCGREIESPHWRRPIIVISELRSETWPRVTEIGFRTSSDEQIRRRNLVYIERYERHVYCEPDLDPWRLGAVGPLMEERSDAVRERHLMRQRLPRPRHILPLNLTFDQIVQILRSHMNWSCGQSGRAYYLPPEDWNPNSISQADWRHGNAFPTDTVDGGRRGYRDREGRIWLWDQFHNIHWDVQLPGGRHQNVSPEGIIL